MKTIAQHLGVVILAIAAVALLAGLALGFKAPAGIFMENIVDQLDAKADGVFGNGGGSENGGNPGGEQGPTTTVTLEGDGQIFDAGVPAPLTFRSPAPLSEFREVQLNGSTVDPSNYSKEEGSTIITLYAEFLENVEPGTYEIAIVSDSMIGKGTFEVSVASGAYDAEGNLLATWTELVSTYGMDVSKDYTSSTYKTDTASPYYVLTNTAELNEVTNLIIPATVTSIGENAFRGCTAFTSIELPASVTTIGSDAFNGCTSLTSIEIPSSVTSIGAYAFYSCSALTSITVADGNSSFVSLGDVLFNNDMTTLVCYPAAKSGTSYSIPDGVTTIAAAAAFYGCKNLENVSFGENSQLTSIKSYAFFGSGLTEITIPASVTKIFTYAFSNCTNLTTVTFAEGSQLTEFGYYTFMDCKALTGIEIPASVTIIGYWCFKNCTSLTSIDLPAGLTKLGQYACENCTKLTTVTYAGTTTQWYTMQPGSYWNYNTPATVVQCSNGTVSLR